MSGVSSLTLDRSQVGPLIGCSLFISVDGVGRRNFELKVLWMMAPISAGIPTWLKEVATSVSTSSEARSLN